MNKPIIPKFVADWIEEHKELYTNWNEYDKGDFVIRCSNDLFRYGEDRNPYDFDITNKISEYTLSNPYDFICAILYGYEIEKEKLYTVTLENGWKLYKSFHYDNISFPTLLFCSSPRYSATPLTKEEIESVDPILMKIAKEIKQ